MKVLVLYRPNSEFARSVEEFVHDFKYRYPDHGVELLSVDTREGADAAKLYDIVQYPAIMVIRNDGFIQNNWQGTPLPLIDEVAAYNRA
jgi:hypothetical protein